MKYRKKQREKALQGARRSRKKWKTDRSGLFTQTARLFFFLSMEVLERERLHTNEELLFFLPFTGEDRKSSVLFSPTAIMLWMSEAGTERLQNLNNDLNEVISMGGSQGFHAA